MGYGNPPVPLLTEGAAHFHHCWFRANREAPAAPQRSTGRSQGKREYAQAPLGTIPYDIEKVYP